MVARDDVCESCGVACRATTTRFADGSRWTLCNQCTRQWLLIWRDWCEKQPQQANRVRARANRDNLARSDGGQPMTDGGRSVDDSERLLGPHRVPRIECGNCGTAHHIDAAAGEYIGHCRNCYAFLRRPTDAEERQFAYFFDWKHRHSLRSALDREESR